MFLSKPGRGPPPPAGRLRSPRGLATKSQETASADPRPGPLRGEKRFTRSSPVLRRKDRS